MSVPRLPPPSLPSWLAPELPFDRYALEIEGHRFHLMESGEGTPVLLVHGNPTWGFLYRRVARALQEDAVRRDSGQALRLIMPDLLGLGLSDKPQRPSVHTLENHARWLGGIIGALEVKRFILVVQDWGGPIGTLGAALAQREHGVELAGLVVLNTVLSEPKAGSRPTTFHRLSRMPFVSDILFRGLGFPQIALGMAQGDRRSMGGRVGRAYRYPLRHLRDRRAPLMLARMVPQDFSHPSIEPLRRCRAFIEAYGGPAAIVWGTAIRSSVAPATTFAASCPEPSSPAPTPAIFCRRKFQKRSQERSGGSTRRGVDAKPQTPTS